MRETLREAAPRHRNPIRDHARTGRQRPGLAYADNEARHNQRAKSARRAGQQGTSGPENTAAGQRDAGAEPIAGKPADYLEGGIAIAERGQCQSKVRVGQVEFGPHIGSRDGQVYAVDVLDEVHQAKQNEDGARGPSEHAGERDMMCARNGAGHVFSQSNDCRFSSPTPKFGMHSLFVALPAAGPALIARRVGEARARSLRAAHNDRPVESRRKTLTLPQRPRGANLQRRGRSS